MVSPILFAGGEDLDFQVLNGTYTPSFTFGAWIDTTAGRFRSGFARHALSVLSNGNIFLRAAFVATQQFWVGARSWMGNQNINNGAGGYVMRFVDAGGVVRLRIKGQSPNGDTISVEKVSAAGVVTQLGVNAASGLSYTPVTPDKIDVFVNYAVAGAFRLYVNGTLVFTYSGDVTTDGQTSLAYIDFGQAATVSWATYISAWSEVIIATVDTRALSLVTQAPTANGNTTTFTSGAVSHINANQYQDINPDISNTAGQLQEYQVTPAIPSGSYSILTVVSHARATVGISGPQHMDFALRIGSTDYFSSDIAPTVGAYGLVAYNWDVNPATGAAWGAGDLPASSTLFNVGYRSVA